MALIPTVRFNETDIYAAYGLAILNIDDLGYPDIKASGDSFAGRAGQGSDVVFYGQRKLSLSGHMKLTTHALLMTAIDSLKAKISIGHYGLEPFRLYLADMSDRYFMAKITKLKITLPQPRYLTLRADVEIEVVIDDPYGQYNTYTMANVAVDPIVSPCSLALNYSGTANHRPRIIVDNQGAGTISSFEILNTAVKNVSKVVTATPANLTRTTGRWGDRLGAAVFSSAVTPSLSFACKGNFNPASFTVSMWIYGFIGAAAGPGYLFSTTGNVIRLYEKSDHTQFIFEIDGNTCTIDHSVSGYAHSHWCLITAAYDGATMYLDLYVLAHDLSFSDSQAGVTYNGLPTNFYVGTLAAGTGAGEVYIDDLRIYNRVLTGIAASVASGSEFAELKAALAPLPITRGCTAYFSFDQTANGVGWGNSDLVCTSSIAQYSILEINCDSQNANVLVAALNATPTDAMASVTGEFPFLVPGTNGIQIIHNGSASGVSLAIDGSRKFL